MVDKVSFGNGAVGFSDQFTVLDDLVTLGKVLQRDLVALGNVLFGADGKQLAAFLIDNVFSLRNLGDAGHHIVGLIHHQRVNFHGGPPIFWHCFVAVVF